MIKVPLLC